MSQITISANGDYVLPQSDGTQIRRSEATAVTIKANTASAVTQFGAGDDTDTFTAYANGTIANDDTIAHGRGAKLMVRVSGITTGSVVIFYNELGV